MIGVGKLCIIIHAIPIYPDAIGKIVTIVGHTLVKDQIVNKFTPAQRDVYGGWCELAGDRCLQPLDDPDVSDEVDTDVTRETRRVRRVQFQLGESK